MDYKQTLNMPNTDFEMKANLSKKEPIIQESWLQKDIYNKVLNKNKNKPIFFLHDGPPYANGNIHVGHALNKSLKDIIVRYKNFAGFYAPYIPGWDTHGLPIEVAMLKSNPNATKDTVIERRQKCREYALKQVENQKQQFRKIGLLSDLQQRYLTLDKNFEIEQLWSFYDMVQKGLIFTALKPVYWSWSSQTSLAEAEIEYHDSKSESIYVAFELEPNDLFGAKTSLLIWTTTPWTLPSNLAVAINPDTKYSLVVFDDRKYIIATELVDKISAKLNKQIITLKVFNATELENLKYYHPIKKDKTAPVILADYVSVSDGTGLVHNAPGFGVDDYLACKKYNIDIYCPIDDYGKFNSTIQDPELENKFYIDANEIIIKRLQDKNNLIHHETIVHSVAHDWRTKKPVMYRATQQWFVNLEKVQDKIINSLKKDVKSPNQKNTDRMIEMIQKRKEWCISRQRVWGVPIPIIFDENSVPIIDLELIKNIIEVLDKKGVDYWFSANTKEFLTPKYLNNKNVDKYKKEKDIMDVWFDSGTSHNLFTRHWNLTYPCDLYLEGSDQYRGWFNSSLITGCIRNDKSPYKAILQHGFTLDENGLKMSKSLGNTIDPLKVFEEYGTDIFRLWVSTTEYTEDQRFGINILKQTAEIYRKIRNTLFKYSLSILSDFDFNKDNKPISSLQNKYILTRLNKVLNQIDEYYTKYELNNVVKTIFNFTLELSSWYFEYIKDPVYCYQINNTLRREIQTTVYYILDNLNKATAPILVHTTEEVYSFFNKPNKKESIHLEDWIQLKPFVEISDNALNQLTQLFVLRTDILYQLEKARNDKLIKKNNEALVSINKKYQSIFKGLNLKEWLLVADVNYIDSDEIIIANAQYNKCNRCWSHKNLNEMHNDEICKTCYDVIKDLKQ